MGIGVTTGKAICPLQQAEGYRHRKSVDTAAGRLVHNSLVHLLILCICVAQAAGCIAAKSPHEAALTDYQRQLADDGPQPRLSTQTREPSNPVGLLQPVETLAEVLPRLRVGVDPNTGQETVLLTMQEAVTRTLANNPEIRIVSYDPEIAKEEIAKAVAEFDPTAFSRLGYEQQDSPQNSLFEAGQADSRTFESGIKQKTILGSEWSASYALSRNWDDLFGRTISTRYEPVLVFQLRQPLLRDAGPQVNLAGVNVAQLQHLIALEAFREKAQAVSAEAITAYWRLAQGLRHVEIQREVVAQAQETLRKVEARREIDVTDVQLMQARASAKLREANLLEFEKQVSDAQDVLARLLADPQINTTSELRIVPVTAPEVMSQPPRLALAPADALAAAMEKNPAVRQAEISVEIADINVRLAENQKMPRLDLVALSRAQGLAGQPSDAHEQLGNGDYMSYEVGVTLEIPLGNRRREAELTRRRLERRKAISTLQNAADRVAVQVKEKARQARTKLDEIKIQQEAAQAAQAQLKALKESEPVRERLTPEFLLVELQAQDTHAEARRAAVDSLIEFNVSLVELARATGTVFELHRVEKALTTVTQLPADAQSGE